MGCSSCQQKRDQQQFAWTSEPTPEGESTQITYTSEMQAKAKVLRAGGTYEVQHVG